MDTKNWKWFRYGEVFVIKKGKRLTKADMIDGNIPYVGATDSNNGITARISNNEHLHSGNTISVSYNGSIAEAYYQAKEFWATDDVNVLYPIFPMTKYSALFFATLINKEKYRFNYGRKWDKELMSVSKIKLPVDTQGNPDWEWIENYVKNTLMPKLPHKAKLVWNDNFNQKPLSKRKKQLNTENWKLFKIGDIFDMTRGKTLPIDTKNDNIGSIPCVNGSAENNGVLCGLNETVERYGFKQQTVPSLSLCRVGLSGKTFLQNKQYYIADNSYSLRLKTQKQNNYVYMFLSVILDMECYKYSYGRTITDKYKDTQIMLPAIQNANGEYEPDWQFMEDYIKSLPYSACL